MDSYQGGCKPSNPYKFVCNGREVLKIEAFLKNWGVKLHPLHDSNADPDDWSTQVAFKKPVLWDDSVLIRIFPKSY